jgi:hypothetical protein
MYCPTDSVAFVTTWYTLAIAVCAALGALVGSRFLLQLKRQRELPVKRTFALVAMLAFCWGQAGCSPPAIPRGASMSWDLKGGSGWTWLRQLQHGCVAWRATEDWAEVDIQTNSQCETPRAWVDGREPRLHYFSALDTLVFAGYWSFDQGSNGGPCRHEISGAQIADLARVANEALVEADTNGERRMLGRIVQQLSTLNGAALENDNGWCSNHRQPNAGEQDVWEDGR